MYLDVVLSKRVVFTQRFLKNKSRLFVDCLGPDLVEEGSSGIATGSW